VAVEILTESLLSPPSTLGPYRHADYLRLPDEPRCELIFGRFYATPAPYVLHQFVALLLALRLEVIARQLGGLVLFAPIDVQLGEHSTVQPDIIYLRPARKVRARTTVEGPPDLIVEVISASTARRDRGEKLRLYAETGVREYWIVDPAAREISFFVNRAGRFEVALALDALYRSEALPELTLDLADFWREFDSRLPHSS
jgi:Uma2 family endonuclease